MNILGKLIDKLRGKKPEVDKKLVPVQVASARKRTYRSSSYQSKSNTSQDDSLLTNAAIFGIMNADDSKAADPGMPADHGSHSSGGSSHNCGGGSSHSCSSGSSCGSSSCGGGGGGGD